MAIIRLFITAVIDSDRLDADMREVAEQETIADGFPIDPDNTGWFIAQRIVDDNNDPGHGITLSLHA
jgi:hypothetical protein